MDAIFLANRILRGAIRRRGRNVVGSHTAFNQSTNDSAGHVAGAQEGDCLVHGVALLLHAGPPWKG